MRALPPPDSLSTRPPAFLGHQRHSAPGTRRRLDRCLNPQRQVECSPAPLPPHTPVLVVAPLIVAALLVILAFDAPVVTLLADVIALAVAVLQAFDAPVAISITDVIAPAVSVSVA